MTSPFDLSALQERVRAAVGSDREIDALIEQWRTGDEPVMIYLGSYAAGDPIQRAGHFDGTDGCSYIAPRVTSSIDAALALVERMDADSVTVLNRAIGSACGHMIANASGPDFKCDPLSKWLPLAILDALLSALISQSEKAESK